MCCIVMVRMLRKCVVLLWCGCYGNVLYCYGADVTDCVVLLWCGCYRNVLYCYGADVTDCVVLLWCPRRAVAPEKNN